MTVTKDETMPVRSSEDIVRVRQTVRVWAVGLSFGLVDQTKLVTAASELSRNAVDYGGGGTVKLEALNNGVRRGLRLTFEDHGPGIANVELVMQDGYSTSSGLGLGLGGARRLANEFEIDSRLGDGTRVCITRWK
jgi:serine/threonine-protein kinase RsbT